MWPLKTRIIGKLAPVVMGLVAVCLTADTNAQDLRSLARSVTGRHGPPLTAQDYARAEAQLAKYFENRPPESISETAWSSLQNQVVAGAVQPGEDYFAVAESGASGDSGSGGDPSDPTNVTFHIMGEWEWQRLTEDDGNLAAFKLSPFIPIKLAGQSLLFNFEVPLPQHAGLTGIDHASGIGDIRLKLFWLINTGNKKVRAVVPAMDAIAPTGDADRGLGGGQWIVMPNIALALQPAKNWAMYPFFRYVHADEVQSTFVPDLPLPDPGNLFDSTELRGFNLEWINVLQLEDAFFSWVEFTPDYFKNYVGSKSDTFTMKYTAAKQLNETTIMMFDFWHPVGGEQTSDYTFKVRLDWYPGMKKCGKCHGRCRCR